MVWSKVHADVSNGRLFDGDDEHAPRTMPRLASNSGRSCPKAQPQYHTAMSPVVGRTTSLFTPAVPRCVVAAYDVATGNVRWEWKGDTSLWFTYSVTLGGTKQVVAANQNVVGISAANVCTSVEPALHYAVERQRRLRFSTKTPSFGLDAKRAHHASGNAMTKWVTEDRGPQGSVTSNEQCRSDQWGALRLVAFE
jgi:hypothetical protein